MQRFSCVAVTFVVPISMDTAFLIEIDAMGQVGVAIIMRAN